MSSVICSLEKVTFEMVVIGCSLGSVGVEDRVVVREPCGPAFCTFKATLEETLHMDTLWVQVKLLPPDPSCDVWPPASVMLPFHNVYVLSRYVYMPSVYTQQLLGCFPHSTSLYCK